MEIRTAARWKQTAGDVTVAVLSGAVLVASVVALPTVWAQKARVDRERRAADVVAAVGRTTRAALAIERAAHLGALAADDTVAENDGRLSAARAADDARSVLAGTPASSPLAPLAAAWAAPAPDPDAVTAAAARAFDDAALQTPRVRDQLGIWQALVALPAAAAAVAPGPATAAAAPATPPASGARGTIAESFLRGLTTSHPDFERQLRIVATTSGPVRMDALLLGTARAESAADVVRTADEAIDAYAPVVTAELSRTADGEDRRARARVQGALATLAVVAAADVVTVRSLLRRRDRRRKRRASTEVPARLDAVTGMLNRAGLTDAASAPLARTRTGPVSLLVVDIDGLGRVNQAGGRLAGDAVLRHVAWQMRINAPPDSGPPLFARWADDAFVALVVRPLLDPAAYATGLHRRLAAIPASGDGEGVTVTASIGLVTCTCGRCGLDDLVTAADAACSTATRDGGATTVTVPCLGTTLGPDAVGGVAGGVQPSTT